MKGTPWGMMVDLSRLSQLDLGKLCPASRIFHTGIRPFFQNLLKLPLETAFKTKPVRKGRQHGHACFIQTEPALPEHDHKDLCFSQKKKKSLWIKVSAKCINVTDLWHYTENNVISGLLCWVFILIKNLIFINVMQKNNYILLQL